MPGALDFTSSLLASSARAWRGTGSFRPAQRQPEKMLELYEFEGCPYCRLVREALTEMDLDALIRPCPKNGTRFRPQAIELGGKAQFPLLADPNTGTQLHESADIIEYLSRTYEARTRAASGLRRTLAVGSSYLATGARGTRGLRARPSRPAQQPLELYSFESSPYSRPVRELLCELELPYVLRNFGKARWEEMGPPLVRAKFFPDAPMTGRNRIRMHELTGRSQVPYLIDPNTDTAMYESAEILRYLERSYAL